MEYRRLGRTDLQVGVIALGTMTWGEPNSESVGHRQIDCAPDHGVDCRHAAEMHPVPPRPGRPAANVAGAEDRLGGEALDGIEAIRRVYTYARA